MSGNNVPSNKFVNIMKGEAFNSVKHFVQYPSPPICYAWNRGMQVPDEMDFIVRHMEIL
mgnify:CR=1 FL=1